MIYLSATETLICDTEIEVDRVYFPRLSTKYVTWFSKYGIELIVAFVEDNATKMDIHVNIDQPYCEESCHTRIQKV